MKIRQARKIIRWGRGDATKWGGPHRMGTRRTASKRVERWLGGVQGIDAWARWAGLR